MIAPTAKDVHYLVLRNFMWAPDTAVFMRKDYWHSFADDIEAGMAVTGDCDDFAMTCIELCSRRGIPNVALRLLLCQVPEVGWHMVGGVDTEDKTLILDNRLRRVADAAELDYHWAQSMRLSHPGVWRVIPAKIFG